MKTAWRKLAVIGLSILMMLALAVPSAFADGPETAKDAKEADITYYQGLGLNGKPSLTLQKYIYDGSDYAAGTSKAIKNVEFKYAKVGNLYQLTLNDGSTVMAYGVTQAFARAVDLTGTADYTYTDNSQNTTYFFTDGDAIQNATKLKGKDDLEDFLVTNATDNEVNTASTDTNGQITDADIDYGLYLVVEYDVSNAKAPIGTNPTNPWQDLAIVSVQAPFIVALPNYDKVNETWENKVTAYIKNASDTATVEKKIVVGTNETLTDGSETVADTDTTSIGDTVYYRLKGTLPSIPDTSEEKISEYVLTDKISIGLTPNTKEYSYTSGTITTVKINATRVTGSGTNSNSITTLDENDYEVTALTNIADSSEYNGGQSFTIKLTTTGLEKITKLAKDATGTGEKAIYFYYSAVVNEKAVIGPNTDSTLGDMGNPNEVKLAYKTDAGFESETDWDKVTHFTFGINVTKDFDADPDTAKLNNVTFRLYRKDTSGNGNIYYNFRFSNGNYHTPTEDRDAASATPLKLDSNKKISINGLEEGTYYLEETATVPGYNLLKEPVELILTADRGVNKYVHLSDDTNYVGTINKTNGTATATGILSVTVTNTKGFTLPSTGGAGIWMFVLGGAVIIALGCGYFILSRKRDK